MCCFFSLLFAPLLCTNLCMTVYINNNPLELPHAAVISHALTALGIEARNGMALAVNSDVIPRPEWDNYTLKEQDKIMIIKATQGG